MVPIIFSLICDEGERGAGEMKSTILTNYIIKKMIFFSSQKYKTYPMVISFVRGLFKVFSSLLALLVNYFDRWGRREWVT